ncbi:MAG: argininosuccinate synthase [Chloroflexota bacterium]|jgi:argininosuccinate synthase|nr:argininosuccinate synthase [Chloroflexota bacterium]
MERVVLAYSGGLDTSVLIPWLREKYEMDVITLTANLGSERDLPTIREKALRTGASEAFVEDARDVFVRFFCWPALQSGALYEGVYPLATALARPLIAKLLVDVAHRVGATVVAHGCTGKGNDQVRFDLAVAALDPSLRIVAPVRDYRMHRDEELEYAREHDIPVPANVDSAFSIDENLWGRSIEAGALEDPWAEPPEEAYAWTRSPQEAPDEAAVVEIEFEEGIPVGLDGQRMDGIELITRLNRLGGEHGVGRIDHIENRLIGIKSREVYEAPAAVILHAAHAEIENLTLSKDQARFKEKVATEIADLVYNGLWFSPLNQDLAAFVASTQRYVTGAVRVKLFKGSIRVASRRAQHSLYDPGLATYTSADTFDHQWSEGFIGLFGLPLRTQARVQWLGRSSDDILRLSAGEPPPGDQKP